MRLPLALLLLATATPAVAMRCALDGVEVNTDNGASTAGKSGMLRCYRPDGTLQREQELRNGEYLGRDRRIDDDGTVHERQVNAHGNTEGRATETWPNGKLKSDGEYRNGAAVGLHRSLHPNGAPAALRYYEKAGESPAATMEFNLQGQLTALRCGTKPLLGEDRGPCGFDGKPVEVELFERTGQHRSTLRLLGGKVLSARNFDRAGRLAESYETTADGRIERRYFENGQQAAESVIAHDHRVADTEWYMNGQVKTRTLREPTDRDPKSTVERFRDDGVIASRTEMRGERSLQQQTFDAQGRPKEEFFYDDEGRTRRHRVYDPDGNVTADDELYPDGSRKSLLGATKIAR